jgi:hypothetical protein
LVDAEALLDPAQALFELAQQNAMADRRGVVLHDSAAKMGDLIAETFFYIGEVGGDVRTQNIDLLVDTFDPLVEPTDIVLRRHAIGVPRDVGAQLAKQLQDEVFGLLGHQTSF